jgi:hypothetical protein
MKKGVEQIDELIEQYNIPEPTEATLFSQDYQEFLETLP